MIFRESKNLIVDIQDQISFGFTLNQCFISKFPRSKLIEVYHYSKFFNIRVLMDISKNLG
jgi:hypothetical protein